MSTVDTFQDIPIHERVGTLRARLLSPSARPLRFVGTGGAAAAIQLLILTSMLRANISPLTAEVVAFLLATQFNFGFSSSFTWHECRGPILRRWLTFHGSIAAMAVLNLAVFALARSYVSPLPASALGIAAGAVGNYFAGELIVFRSPRSRSPDSKQRSAA